MSYLSRLFCIWLSFAPLAWADVSDSHTGDKQQLIALKQLFEQAVQDNQIQQLKPFLAPNFSVVMFTDNEFHDFDQFVQQWNLSREKFLQGGAYQISLNPNDTQFFDDMALATGNAQHHMTNGTGQVFEFSSHWSVLAQQMDGQWKLVRIHASTNPFNNPFVTDGVQSLLIKACLISVGVGLLLGVVGLNLWRRFRASPRVA